jgi:hypothetical protein
MVAVNTFGWVGLDGLTDTEYGEDRRQQHRSVRADVVRILWRGHMWCMPEGCVFRHGDGVGLIQDGYQ